MDKKEWKKTIITWSLVGAIFGGILGILAYNNNWLG